MHDMSTPRPAPNPTQHLQAAQLTILSTDKSQRRFVEHPPCPPVRRGTLPAAAPPGGRSTRAPQQASAPRTMPGSPFAPTAWLLLLLIEPKGDARNFLRSFCFDRGRQLGLRGRMQINYDYASYWYSYIHARGGRNRDESVLRSEGPGGTSILGRKKKPRERFTLLFSPTPLTTITYDG